MSWLTLGGKVNKKGRARHFTSPEELERQRKEDQRNWRVNFFYFLLPQTWQFLFTDWFSSLFSSRIIWCPDVLIKSRDLVLKLWQNIFSSSTAKNECQKFIPILTIFYFKAKQEEASGSDSDGSKSEKSGSGSGSESEEESGSVKPPNAAVDIENPNHVVKQAKKVGDLDVNDATKPELSRREREEIDKQKAREHYQKLHAQGKTDEARADLARLAIIRQQREEAAKKRDDEKKSK